MSLATSGADDDARRKTAIFRHRVEEIYRMYKPDDVHKVDVAMRLRAESTPEEEILAALLRKMKVDPLQHKRNRVTAFYQQHAPTAMHKVELAMKLEASEENLISELHRKYKVQYPPPPQPPGLHSPSSAPAATEPAASPLPNLEPRGSDESPASPMSPGSPFGASAGAPPPPTADGPAHIPPPPPPQPGTAEYLAKEARITQFLQQYAPKHLKRVPTIMQMDVAEDELMARLRSKYCPPAAGGAAPTQQQQQQQQPTQVDQSPTATSAAGAAASPTIAAADSREQRIRAFFEAHAPHAIHKLPTVLALEVPEADLMAKLREKYLSNGASAPSSSPTSPLQNMEEKRDRGRESDGGALEGVFGAPLGATADEEAPSRRGSTTSSAGGAAAAPVAAGRGAGPRPTTADATSRNSATPARAKQRASSTPPVKAGSAASSRPSTPQPQVHTQRRPTHASRTPSSTQAAAVAAPAARMGPSSAAGQRDHGAPSHRQVAAALEGDLEPPSHRDAGGRRGSHASASSFASTPHADAPTAADIDRVAGIEARLAKYVEAIAAQSAQLEEQRRESATLRHANEDLHRTAAFLRQQVESEKAVQRDLHSREEAIAQREVALSALEVALEAKSRALATLDKGAPGHSERYAALEAEAAQSSASDSLRRLQQHLVHVEGQLFERCVQLQAHRELCAAKEKALLERERTLLEREERFSAREKAREEADRRSSVELSTRRAALTEAQKAHEAASARLRAERDRIDVKEEDLATREREVEVRRQQLDARAAAIETQSELLERERVACQKLSSDVLRREATVRSVEKSLNIARAELTRLEDDVTARARKLIEEEDALRKWGTAISKREASTNALLQQARDRSVTGSPGASEQRRMRSGR